MPKPPIKRPENPLFRDTSKTEDQSMKLVDLVKENKPEPEMPPVAVQPEEATLSPAPAPMATQPTQPAPVQEKEQPLLYKSEHSADWLIRPYIDQYDKQALSADPYYIGAVEAGCVLLRMSKTEAFNEMMVDWLAKHADVLEARPDVVRLKEEKYRKKHRI